MLRLDSESMSVRGVGCQSTWIMHTCIQDLFHRYEQEFRNFSSWHPKDRHIKEAVLCNDKRVKVFSTFYSPNMTLAMTKASKTSAPKVVIIKWSLIGQKKFSIGYPWSAKSPKVIANHKLVNKLSMNSCHSFIHSLTHTLIWKSFGSILFFRPVWTEKVGRCWCSIKNISGWLKGLLAEQQKKTQEENLQLFWLDMDSIVELFPFFLSFCANERNYVPS